MAYLTSSEAKENIEHILYWENDTRSKVYTDVAYLFKDYSKEAYKGEKEKPEMR